MPLQTAPRNISIRSSQTLDAFSKTRVSQVTTETFMDFSYGFLQEKNRTDVISAGSGTATFSSTNRGIAMGRASTTLTSSVGVGSPLLVHLKAGNSIKTYISFKINDASLLIGNTANYAYVGVGDYLASEELYKGFIGLYTSNGVYSIKVQATSFSGTNVGTYSRSSWTDPLDGTGPSAITIDFTKVQILFIKQQSGRNGNLTIGFIIGGEEVIALKIGYTNNTPISPLSTDKNIITTAGPCAGLYATATGTAGTVLTVYNGVSMFENAGQDLLSTYQFSHSTVTSSIPSGSFKRIVTYRINTSIATPFFTKIVLTELEIMSTGNDGFYWELRYRESGSTSGTWIAVDSNSNVEYNVNNTSTTGGTVITGGFVNAGEKVNFPLPESIANSYPLQNNDSYQLNVHRTISLWIKPFSTSTSSVATMIYKEIQ